MPTRAREIAAAAGDSKRLRASDEQTMKCWERYLTFSNLSVKGFARSFTSLSNLLKNGYAVDKQILDGIKALDDFAENSANAENSADFLDAHRKYFTNLRMVSSLHFRRRNRR